MRQETLTKKEQEYTKAARMRYAEGKEHSEIAEELGYKHQTVRRWFSEGKIEDVKRKFSDREKYLLQRSIEQDIWDAEQTAKDLLGDAQRLAEESKDFRQIAESQIKIREKKIKLLQELGIIEKPKQRREVEGSASVTFNEELVEERLAEYYENENEGKEQEVEQ